RARTVDDNRIAYLESGDAVHVKAPGADRHIVVRDVVLATRDLGKVVAAMPGSASRHRTLELDKTVHEGMLLVIALGGARGAQDGSRWPDAFAAQNDSGGANRDLAGDVVLSSLEQHSAAEAVGIERQIRDLIDGGLDDGAGVNTLGGRLHDGLDGHEGHPLGA